MYVMFLVCFPALGMAAILQFLLSAFHDVHCIHHVMFINVTQSGSFYCKLNI